ncbi:hypothetical protein Thein_0627 [Thermodesulfatator indicus DSM 15286]|uniref:Uncharacterized protein n=1 Tax=Thermodesulfatator indicus (strain DSM 15286 / JCM 11887 / CIR29812) TaxID=667014 RepID=F8ABQ6_THEID|nr:hypothetical protein Thein_0627 [Thermodesulfatator indicus DSM 15286]
MNWPSFTLKEKIYLFSGIILCILFSIRYYPENLERTIYESFRWVFSFFFYSGVMAYMFSGICRKFLKQPFPLKSGIKLAIWLAVLSAIAQSLHETFKMYNP